MATDKQIAANRANAKKSTGPRTPAGKARAVRNAFALGLTTDQLLAPTEPRGPLTRHAASLRAHFAPATPIESLLVDRIIAATWRLRRARLIETRIYHQRAKELKKWAGKAKKHPLDPLADIFRHTINENSLQRLSLDEARLERSLYRALKELNSFKLERNRNKFEKINSGIEPNPNPSHPHEIKPLPSQFSENHSNPFGTHQNSPVAIGVYPRPSAAIQSFGKICFMGLDDSNLRHHNEELWEF